MDGGFYDSTGKFVSDSSIRSPFSKLAELVMCSKKVYAHLAKTARGSTMQVLPKNHLNAKHKRHNMQTQVRATLLLLLVGSDTQPHAMHVFWEE